MRNTNTTIEHYSEILENDITINLSINYEVSNTGNGDVDEDEYLQAQFLSSDVTILNTDLDDSVAKEFFTNFENYEDDLREEIENNLNN